MTTTYEIVKVKDKYNIELTYVTTNYYLNEQFNSTNKMMLDESLFRMICKKLDRNFNRTLEELNLQTGFLNIYQFEFIDEDQLKKITDIIDEYLIIERMGL